MVYGMTWWAMAKHGIWYCLACMTLCMVWHDRHGMVNVLAWRAWHGMWYGLVGITWCILWPGGHGMVYGMA